jgi:tRNA nucleotidyltransferase (CCA-adding enzyme)
MSLALDGRAVMEILGCGPGPEVGRALRHLAKAVEADPTCNTAGSLRARLLGWRSATGID